MTASREVGFGPDPVLVGRAAELESLDSAVATVRAGRSVAVEVCGEAGLGKTRILRELARRATDAGLLVRLGRATQYEQGVPFGLYAEMVEAAGSGPDDAAQPSVPAAVRRMLTRAPEPGAALLLDDVHWADSASLELTEHLIGNPPPVPMLLAVTFRSACPPARLVNAIARLGPAATLIDLPPLDVASLDILLAGVPRRRRELILRASLGNPLYIQALSRLDDTELDGLVSLARRQDPVDADCLAGSRRSVLAGLAAEITAQQPSVQRVAHIAAVVGDHTTIDLVGHVAGLPMPVVTAAVDQLGRLGLLDADGGRLRYRHPLMRASAYALTGAAWRFEAHTRTAGYLRGRRASRQLVAHHTERSARHGDETAVATLVDAGVAFAHEAPAQAARWLGTALRIMPDMGAHDERRAEVAMWYARALGRSGELARSREVLQRLRRAEGPVQRRAETFSVAVARQLGDFAEAAATLGTQLGRGGLDPVEEAKLHVELAAVDAFREEPTSAVHHAQRALELLDERRSVLVAAALTLRALATLYLGCARSAREQLAAAVVAVDATGDADLRPYVEIVSPLALVEIQLGNLADADRHLARARRILDGLGPSSASPYLLVMESLVHTRAGRLARAVRAAEEARAAAERVGSTEMAAMAAAVRLRPVLWTAGPAAALDTAGPASAHLDADLSGAGPEVAVGQPRSRAWWRINRVELALAKAVAGDWGGGADLLIEPAAPPSRHPPVLVARDLVAAVAAVGRGDHTTARQVGEQAERRATAAGLPYEIGLARFARAFTAYRMADPERATTLAESAAACFAAAGTPMEAALSCHLAGAAYLVAGRPGPGAAALDRAETGYRACGAGWAASVLAGHRAAGPARAGRPGGDAVLTAREREIAGLATTGLSNKEIAARLYLSPRTIESHLNRVFAKLQVHSRTAMARRLTEALGDHGPPA
ncbi:helix-turn-helix transcriptional regulator [Micromonospora sediminimaris]|uniref:Transcriptional regulator n=1 Tax=Micromonospora sediminimaris TaxID=547162 RepID=A0A9W5UQE0_9ACTN|nr:LuxR family transcriptional regulator [Micromonospora sediminimaris]GIJ32694.1 transcriptional regulator [Micromonospora sediminimaris]SFD16246.1 Predicted ATPase [Micromonospora sediminimaris]